MKTCPKCRIPLLFDKFYKSKSRYDGLNSWCKDCLNEYKRGASAQAGIKRSRLKYKNGLKNKIVNVYGNGSCNCCGEKEISFLTLDHVHNNGSVERAALAGAPGRGGFNFYVKLKILGFPRPEDYQVLCMNCQFGKQFRGICPHQNKQEVISAVKAL